MAMTEKTPANLGRDQPHFDLLGLQLQLQSDDEREAATLIRPNALHVELSAVRNGKSRCGDDRSCRQRYAREEQCGAKISAANNLSPGGLGPQG
jgi:hypothetical protein